jgi:hypothetical protein
MEDAYLPSSIEDQRITSQDEMIHEINVLEHNFSLYKIRNGNPDLHWRDLDAHIKQVRALPGSEFSKRTIAVTNQKIHRENTTHAMVAGMVNDMFNNPPQNELFLRSKARYNNWDAPELRVPSVFRRDQNMYNRTFGFSAGIDTALRGTRTEVGMLDPSDVLTIRPLPEYQALLKNYDRGNYIDRIVWDPSYGYLRLSNSWNQTMGAGVKNGVKIYKDEDYFTPVLGDQAGPYPGWWGMDFLAPEKADPNNTFSFDLRKTEVGNFLIRSDFLHTKHLRNPETIPQEFLWDAKMRSETELSEPPTVHEVLHYFPSYNIDQHKISAENEVYTRRLASLYEHLDEANLPSHYRNAGAYQIRVEFDPDANPSNPQRDIVEEINSLYRHIEDRNAVHHGTGVISGARSDYIRYHPYTGIRLLWE